MSFRNQGQNQSKFRPGAVKKEILRSKKEMKWFKKPGKHLQRVVHWNLRWSKNGCTKSVVRVNYVGWHGGKEIAAIHLTVESSNKQHWSNPNTPKHREWQRMTCKEIMEGKQGLRWEEQGRCKIKTACKDIHTIRTDRLR